MYVDVFVIDLADEIPIAYAREVRVASGTALEWTAAMYQMIRM